MKKMVEVFITNVVEKSEAALLVKQIEHFFSDYKANFDLEDCDRILRIKSDSGVVDADRVIKYLSLFGYAISLLPDTVKTIKKYPLHNILDSRTSVLERNPAYGFVTRIQDYSGIR